MDMNKSLQDFENLVPITTIRLDEKARELRITKQKKDQESLETNIERIKLSENSATTSTALINNFNNNNIPSATCLKLEDVKEALFDGFNWKVHDILFRNVLVYGYAVVNRQSTTKEGITTYEIILDDETESIACVYFKRNSVESNVIQTKNVLTREKNHLDHRENTGINLRGQYYPSDSDECREIVESVKSLQDMIYENIQKSQKKFSLGPINEKVLVYAKPFISQRSNQLELSILDINECDEMELSWKRNLNKLYTDTYLK